MRNYLLISLFTILSVYSAKAQYGTIYGKLTNDNGEILELVNISVKGKPFGTSSDFEGNYELKIPANENVTVSFSSIGYLQIDSVININSKTRVAFNMIMQRTAEQLQEVFIEDKEVRKNSLTRIDPKLMSTLPDASGNFESMIKTLPGVSSNNELSSQYSVRGGNFDENLVYVNGIQIYRPFLIRSGQQEGMSFINSDMVSSVLFSAGGFDAKYGDKMSSVLDIKYKRPNGWGGAATAHFGGGSVAIFGDSKNHRLRHISGFRYKKNKYILNTLDESGDYDPQFTDFQTNISYDLTSNLEISFLGNYAANVYRFIPSTRTTKFGPYNQPMELTFYFDGKEIDKFTTYTGALQLNYRPTDDLNLGFIGSAFNTSEQETFDISSEYSINIVNKELGSDELGDSVASVGTGSYLKHARNYLDATVYSFEHNGDYKFAKNKLQWGLRWQHEQIADNLTEWKMIDSAGYSLPYDDQNVNMAYYIRGKNNLTSNRFTPYIQNTYSVDVDSAELTFTGGVRASYWDFNKELIISPRFNIAYKPNWENDFLFRFSAGYYYQPAFYKEMRSLDGESSLNKDIKAQKSIHFVFGSDYNFIAWNRPFKLVSEVYYKVLKDLVTYDVDNVRILYSGQNDADGYAAGIDMKINGEFVKGVDSWLSVSLMKTMEDVRGDTMPIRDDEFNIVGEKAAGYIPRPTDQRFSASLFFQDYLPGNPSYKMHLQMNFSTGLPYGPPNKPHYSDTLRMRTYKRVDIGFSKVLKDQGRVYPKGHIFHHINEAWISFEVFNLLDNNNTISHEWVQDYSGRGYAVDNRLTGRQWNLKLSVRF